MVYTLPWLFSYLFYSTDRSKAVVPVLVLLFVALWFYEAICFKFCVILFLCFSVLLALRLPSLGKRELILVLFVRLFDLRLFGFVCFLFLFLSRKGCGLWLWHSLDFPLSFFVCSRANSKSQKFSPFRTWRKSLLNLNMRDMTTLQMWTTLKWGKQSKCHQDAVWILLLNIKVTNVY